MPKKWQFISGTVATLARNSGNFQAERWQFCSGLCKNTDVFWKNTDVFWSVWKPQYQEANNIFPNALRNLEKDSKKNGLFSSVLHGVMDKMMYHFTLVNFSNNSEIDQPDELLYR
ncbi:MAG: hypothetical protein JRJ45_08165 [Deltaproteobacteria bacterium]|nr:hypothetical protein [Deltaproteobacteria bacterium]